MGKFISWLLAIIIVLFITVFIAWNMFPGYVSSKLSKMMKVPVSIEHIGIFPSSMDVKKVKVGNPKGSILSHALKIKTIDADVPITHFLDHQIVIPKMTIDDIYLGLEFDKMGEKKGNWTTIMKNLNDSIEATAKESKYEKRTVLIQKLILTNITIDLAFRDTGKVKRLSTISRLEYNNVSSEGGLPTAQITNLIMQEMLKEVFSLKNLGNMLEGVIKGKNGVLDTIKGFFSYKIEDSYVE